MKEEPIWKIGRAWVNIQTALNDSLELVEKNPDIYLTRNFLADINVHKQDWDLEEDDEFFACMNEDGFSKLQPSDPSQPIVPYDAVEPPDSDPPTNVWELESCAVKIAGWFDELRYRKLSEDGHGMAWPKTAGLWYPRQRTKFEYDSYSGNRMTVPWELSDAHATEGDPHHVYYAWFGDDCLEGVVLRSELQMLLGCTIAEMQRASLCQYNIPVLLLSVHGAKARIMIAHFNQKTMKLDLKCSKFQQFDGFEARAGETGKKRHTSDRARPHDFNAKRDLFFRWLNPVCKGETFLKDSEDAPEVVKRKKKGKTRFVRRHVSAQSKCTQTS